MEALPREIVRVLRVFENVFSEWIWDWVLVLVVGAILTASSSRKPCSVPIRPWHQSRSSPGSSPAGRSQ